MQPIIDLHCDLLSFLADHPETTHRDPRSLCSYPDLVKGNVKTQVLAVFTTTSPTSVVYGEKQIACFESLLKNHPDCFQRIETPSAVQILFALENASSFSLEQEPWTLSLERLEGWIQKVGTPLYIGLTWGDENRFGGGDQTMVGLKDDGKRLLEWMHQKKIALDFSHTSDPLAYDLFNWIDKKGLDIPVIASHSNFRQISSWPRNLPKEIAQEIMKRNGLIGLNFFAPFIDKTDHTALVRHVEYALTLGAAKHLCFGADFFYAEDPLFIALREKKYDMSFTHYPQMGNSSCYPYVLKLLRDKLGLSEDLIQGISYFNARRLIAR